ncbi:cyclic GMP-AMP synthase DncV-like nucleotidyltransferase [Pseudomonas alvandae]|uniref:cyclic GMP-AMP synthase DncV-like nucleotidyltransferase n=1 Tax=Pseudomonas TaxID=286 RepID=UPI00389AB327
MGKAVRLFNGAAEQTLYSRVTPTTEQRAFLQEQWNALAEYLKERLAVQGYPVSTWLQGSYKYGTLIKPVHKGEEYDVDVGVYFAWNPEEEDGAPTAQELRSWVQSVLCEYKSSCVELTEVLEPPKERCSRAVYVKQFHIDTPTYRLIPSTDQRRLACLSGRWEDSDPKQLYKWFRDTVDPDSRSQLRRLVRYLKGWAAVAFDDVPEARPSSIFLTVTSAEACCEVWGEHIPSIGDDDVLVAVVDRIYKRLAQDRSIPNPVDKTEDLNRIPMDAWDAFLQRLRGLNDSAQAANAAEDESSAVLAWEQAFSFLMPLPETDELEVVESATEKALMQVPDIDIAVYDRKGGALLTTYRNEVPNVERNRWLVFSIVNKQAVPDSAEIGWTVRNDGEKADYIGDLGHSKKGRGMFTVEESTAYLGKHYMDCVVFCDGSVFAVRRVTVSINPGQQKLAAQAPRAWVKLRTRRGRRG